MTPRLLAIIILSACVMWTLSNGAEPARALYSPLGYQSGGSAPPTCQ